MTVGSDKGEFRLAVAGTDKFQIHFFQDGRGRVAVIGVRLSKTNQFHGRPGCRWETDILIERHNRGARRTCRQLDDGQIVGFVTGGFIPIRV